MIRFRATRAVPPGLVSEDQDRRALYSAALQQSEDLFDAARAVGPLARPIPLFYVMSQAGRAVAAAWLKDNWQFGGHGLTQVRENEDWKTGGILKFKIQPQGKQGAFGAVAQAQGAQILTGGVELGALWSALPGDNPAPPGGWLRAMPIWPQVYIQGQEALARFGATQRSYVFLQGQIPEDNPLAIIDHLRKYPAAAGARLETPQNILQRGWTPWGYGPSILRSQQSGQAQAEAAGVPAGAMLESYWTGRVPAYRYQREHWLVPVVGDRNDELPPILLWWALLFGLSLLARYEPVAWRAALDPDKSEIACQLERLVDDALDIAPELLFEAITHRPALLPARV